MDLSKPLPKPRPRPAHSDWKVEIPRGFSTPAITFTSTWADGRSGRYALIYTWPWDDGLDEESGVRWQEQFGYTWFFVRLDESGESEAIDVAWPSTFDYPTMPPEIQRWALSVTREAILIGIANGEDIRLFQEEMQPFPEDIGAEIHRRAGSP